MRIFRSSSGLDGSLAALLAAAAMMFGCGETSSPGTPVTPPGGTFFRSGDAMLSYALDLPPGPGPFPAIVFGHGSGRQTKDEAMSVKSRMTQAGFAVLRYDKRGVGQSTGTFEAPGLLNSDRLLPILAGDMVAGVDFLRSRPEIDPSRIGLMGISQAGWIIPLAAERSPHVRYMVLVVGPTVPVGIEIYYSDLAEGTTTSFDELSARLLEYRGPRGFDPRPTLERLDVPGLWLLGAQDRSIPTRETVAVLDELSRAGRPYRWIVYPDAGHFIPPDDYVGEAAAFARSFR
ncbi:MAG TPA: prolyl oligopeptidase family serine peptidase [Vicinamibacteria bacterium]|nr:prolyl oligopeptidase family serine peptidase [Vicinamibacteria bacterium]